MNLEDALDEPGRIQPNLQVHAWHQENDFVYRLGFMVPGFHASPKKTFLIQFIYLSAR